MGTWRLIKGRQGKARDGAESEKNAGEWKEEGQGLVRAPQDVLDVVLRLDG